MNALNTKFSSGDTAPQMTAHQSRTDIGMGSDKPWQDYLKKKRKHDAQLAKAAAEIARAKAKEYRERRKAKLAAAVDVVRVRHVANLYFVAGAKGAKGAE